MYVKEKLKRKYAKKAKNSKAGSLPLKETFLHLINATVAGKTIKNGRIK
ncbi:MAG: hypothetical protein LBC64_07225 [Fibromonadaceae bacterium]|jgi:hypothetical protein|nr:hypothetical protein [Fibromonadaceae bacterium]